MKNEEFFVGEAVHHPQRILLFLETVLNFYKKVFPRLDVSCFCVCFGLAKKTHPQSAHSKIQNSFPDTL